MHGLRVSDVTRIFAQIESGDPSAADKLLPLVYDELRKLAAVKLEHEITSLRQRLKRCVGFWSIKLGENSRCVMAVSGKE